MKAVTLEQISGLFEVSLKQMSELFDKRFAEQDAKFDKIDKRFAEQDAKLDKVTNTNGALTNKIGRLIENIVLPGIVKKFNEKGFHFDSVTTQTDILKEEGEGNLTEIDALLENGEFAIAVETKTDVQISNVNKHIKRLEKLRNHPRFKGKKLYGAIAAAIVPKKSANYALEQGFYVLQQPDALSVRILNFPKGYSAKAW